MEAIVVGFLGLWFFGILSLTSFIPLTDVAFEHCVCICRWRQSAFWLSWVDTRACFVSRQVGRANPQRAHRRRTAARSPKGWPALAIPCSQAQRDEIGGGLQTPCLPAYSFGAVGTSPDFPHCEENRGLPQRLSSYYNRYKRNIRTIGRLPTSSLTILKNTARSRKAMDQYTKILRAAR